MSSPVAYDLSCFATIINSSDSNIDSRVNITNYTTKSSNQPYKVIRYNKTELTKDLYSTYGLLRSVIVNAANRIVSFAPPKSIDPESFIKNLTASSNQSIVYEEFVEGTMINVFWDPCLSQSVDDGFGLKIDYGIPGGWQIASRSTVGCEVAFYHNKGTATNANSVEKGKTFHTMFMEACQANNLSLQSLDPQICYSFVLQHPDNRIVVPFNKPQLYLVDLFHIDNDNMKVYPISLEDVKATGISHVTGVKFPEVYNITETNGYEQYCSPNTDYRIMGVVIKNPLTGERCKLRNPVYEEIRRLKGNQPKLQYQYLLLRQQGKVGDFLKFYPENKKEFSAFRDQVHQFTEALYRFYVSCYINKESPLATYPSQFKTHMFTLHQLYLTTLKEKKEIINNAAVINYVNSLHPSKLMFSLNFHMRKPGPVPVDNMNANAMDIQ